jgi:site-specific recombinase XerD
VLEFLEHLQSTRGNAPRPRNARLTAIKSCMHFVEHRVPGALEQSSRVLAMPNRKTDRPLVDHLTAEQCTAILDHPEPTTRLGIRDRAMLHVSVTAGWRVAELVGLRLNEVAFESRYLHLHVRGKGRKNRLLTLWKAVAESVRAWLTVRGAASVPALFLHARGKEMTRAGFESL